MKIGSSTEFLDLTRQSIELGNGPNGQCQLLWKNNLEQGMLNIFHREPVSIEILRRQYGGN